MSDALRAFFSRLRAIFFKTRLDGEFNEELAAHVDLLAAENEKAGMTPEEARRAVVGDVRHLALEEKSGSEFYIPIRQTQDYPSVDLVVRTSLAPRELML